jgi:hypothetical protein
MSNIQNLEKEQLYVTPEKKTLDIFREKVIDVANDDFYLDTESLECYDDELLNEKMKGYLDKDYDNSAILPSSNAKKRPFDDDDHLHVTPEKTALDIFQEKVSEVANLTSACSSKYRNFRTVIDLTDEFNTTEYVEEVFSVVEVVDLTN